MTPTSVYRTPVRPRFASSPAAPPPSGPRPFYAPRKFIAGRSPEDRTRIRLTCERVAPGSRGELERIYGNLASLACQAHRGKGWTADGFAVALARAIQDVDAYEGKAVSDKEPTAWKVKRYTALLEEAGLIRVDRWGQRGSRILRITMTSALQFNGGMAYHEARSAAEAERQKMNRRRQRATGRGTIGGFEGGVISGEAATSGASQGGRSSVPEEARPTCYQKDDASNRPSEPIKAIFSGETNMLPVKEHLTRPSVDLATIQKDRLFSPHKQTKTNPSAPTSRLAKAPVDDQDPAPSLQSAREAPKSPQAATPSDGSRLPSPEPPGGRGAGVGVCLGLRKESPRPAHSTPQAPTPPRHGPPPVAARVSRDETRSSPPPHPGSSGLSSALSAMKEAFMGMTPPTGASDAEADGDLKRSWTSHAVAYEVLDELVYRDVDEAAARKFLHPRAWAATIAIQPWSEWRKGVVFAKAAKAFDHHHRALKAEQPKGLDDGGLLGAPMPSTPREFVDHVTAFCAGRGGDPVAVNGDALARLGLSRDEYLEALTAGIGAFQSGQVPGGKRLAAYILGVANRLVIGRR